MMIIWPLMFPEKLDNLNVWDEAFFSSSLKVKCMFRLWNWTIDVHSHVSNEGERERSGGHAEEQQVS